MDMKTTVREKPLQSMGVAMALGFGASFLVPALRRRVLSSSPSAIGTILAPVVARFAREGAERIFTYAVEQLQHRDAGSAKASRRT